MLLRPLGEAKRGERGEKERSWGFRLASVRPTRRARGTARRAPGRKASPREGEQGRIVQGPRRCSSESRKVSREAFEPLC
jgi:hypothetical protein